MKKVLENVLEDVSDLNSQFSAYQENLDKQFQEFRMSIDSVEQYNQYFARLFGQNPSENISSNNLI